MASGTDPSTSPHVQLQGSEQGQETSQQKQQQEQPDVLQAAQLDEFTRSIIHLGALVLGEILHGLKISFGVWLAAKLVAYVLPVIQPGVVSLYAHAAALLQNRSLHAAIQAGRQTIARDGADDDNFVNLLLHVSQVVIYLTTVLVVRYWSLLWRTVWSWLPSLGAVTTLGLFWWVYIDDPFNTLVHEGGKLARVLFSMIGYLTKALVFVAARIFRLVEVSYRFYYKQKIKIFKPVLAPHHGAAYPYRVLGADEIRLLEISRKGPFGDYTCKVVHVAFQSSPVYEAISYTWGGLPPSHDLVVEDGYVLKVSERVMEIIRARASVLDSKSLWIDAVCINQGDRAERAVQVGLMAEIYQNASKTIVWLGMSPEASACISFINRHMVTFHLNRPNTNWKALFRIGSREAGWQEFLNFLEHPYWSRMWIIQEIVLSTKPIISYGGEYFTFEYLQTFFREMYSKNVGTMFVMTETAVEPKGPIAPGGSVQIPLIMAMKSLVQGPEGSAVGMPDLMQMTRRCKAFDPRDMVYGVLGLLRASGDQSIVPDYEKTPTDVCIEVGRHCFALRPQHTLTWAGIGFKRTTTSLPSWCPDYCGPWELSPLHQDNTNAPDISYNASAGTPPSLTLHPSLPILTVRAVQFDTIADLGPKCIEAAQVTGMDVTAAAKFLAESTIALSDFTEAALAAMPHHQSEDPESSEMIWRTLIGDRNPTTARAAARRPADASYGEHCRASQRLARALINGPDHPDAPQASDAFTKSGVGPFFDDEVGNGLFLAAHANVGAGRRIAVTKKGSLSLVPEYSRVGDTVGVLAGVQACVVLREEPLLSMPRGDDEPVIRWRLVGEAYVHGHMDGRALSGDDRWETIHIW
jgi:hypothetical protein